MRAYTLSGMKAGITRLRSKGGASPDSFYDLTNAYINAARDVVPRGGTRVLARVPGTIGLTVHDGMRHVYSAQPVTDMPEGYVIHVLLHPTDATLTLKRIHFAEPLMNHLFVVAEFANGDVFYYYLTEGSGFGDAWQANTVYKLRQMVRPSVPNGLFYEATRLNPAYDAWAPNVERQVGDKIEPTVYNGYYYEVVEVMGSRPRSGDFEPAWPEVENEVVVEDADNEDSAPTGPTDPTLPPDVPNRYPTGGGSGKPNDNPLDYVPV